MLWWRNGPSSESNDPFFGISSSVICIHGRAELPNFNAMYSSETVDRRRTRNSSAAAFRRQRHVRRDQATPLIGYTSLDSASPQLATICIGIEAERT